MQVEISKSANLSTYLQKLNMFRILVLYSTSTVQKYSDVSLV